MALQVFMLESQRYSHNINTSKEYYEQYKDENVCGTIVQLPAILHFHIVLKFLNKALKTKLRFWYDCLKRFSCTSWALHVAFIA